MAKAIDDFFAEHADAESRPFKPYCTRSHKADALTVFLFPDSYESQRLTDHVTVYVALENPDKIVGCRIKGIEEILAGIPNSIRINHNGVQLSLLFWAYGTNENDAVRSAFQQMKQGAGDMIVPLAIPPGHEANYSENVTA